MTLIKESLANRLIRLNKTKFDSVQKRLRSISGKDIVVSGKVCLNFKLGNRIVRHNALICSDRSAFPGGILLGRDLFSRINSSIVTKCRGIQYVELEGKRYNYKKTGTVQSVCLVKERPPADSYMALARTNETLLIEARSAVHTRLKVPKHLNQKTVVLSSVARTNDLMVPRIVAVVEDGSIPATLFNCLDTNIELKSQTTIGKIELIHENDFIPLENEGSSVESELCATVTESIQNEVSYPEENNRKRFGANENQSQAVSDDPPISYVDEFSNSDLIDDKLFRNDKDFNVLIDKLELSHLRLEDRKALLNLIYSHRDAVAVNDEIGHVTIKPHVIQMEENKAPTFTPAYRLPHACRELIEKEVEKLQKQDIIEPAASPWSSPVLLLKKKNGDFRFCIDYRRVNKNIKRDMFPLPRVDDILENLRDSSVFTTLDMKNSFHQIELDEGSRDFTAFRTMSGSYRFKRSPQGLSTSPAAYQRACNLAFHDQLGKFLFSYIDDIVIYSKNFQEHLKHLSKILGRIEMTGFKLGLQKCQFAAPSIKYLGHVVDRSGIHVDKDKVKAISEMMPPTNVKMVRSFLGACGYYRKFIKDYSKIAAPLTELTKKGRRFKWTESCQDAFDCLKSKLTSAPVLAFPDYNRQFILHCDASNVAIGGVLNQVFESGERPVGYFSRKLRGTEVNYSITEREALAIFESVKFFTPYLYLNKFTTVTDHAALKFIFKNKNTVPRISRWAMYLADFDYEILYKTGKEHFVPDLLSRNELEGDLNEEVVCVVEEAVQKIDSETLRKEIKADPVWGKMFRYLSGEDVRAPKRCDPSEFFIDDNILYRVPKVKNENRINYQIVIPHSLVNHALELSHDSEIAAHSGVLRTLKRSRLHFFWLNQTRDVMNYVKSCLPCQKRKWQGQGTAPLGSFPAVSHPLERVGVDLIEMTPSYEGNKYILTVIDHFSRYVSAYPLPNKTSQTVTEAMFRFVCDNSVPREVVSDRGTEFNNELFKKVCENLKAKNKFTTSYHPMANGATEKANSTIKKTLSHLSEEDRFCWDKQVSLTCLAINTSYQSSIKEIPFFIHHGRDARLPFNDLVNKLPEINYAEEDYAAEMSLRLSKAFTHVKTMSQRSRDSAVKYYNRKVAKEAKKISIGSLVLLKNETGGSETTLSWPTRYVGPYRVTNKFNNNFEIRGVFADKRIQTVHANRVKLAILRDDVPYPFNNAVENDDTGQDKSDMPENVMPSENCVEPQGETLHHARGDDQPPHIAEAETGRSRYNLRKRR